MLSMFSWCKLNLIHGNQHSLWILLKVINVLRKEDLALLTVTSIRSIRKSTKNRNSETRWQGNRKFKAVQGSNRSKNREIELINKEKKEVWRKRKEKVFNRRNRLIHNMEVILYCCWRTCFIRIRKY